MLLSREARALLWKEIRQLRRSRGALLSATLVPFFLLVITPLTQLLSLRYATAHVALDAPAFMPPGLKDLDQPVRAFVTLVFPLFVTLSGLIVPSVTAIYTIVTERERRSLELVMALPVRVRDILAAKLAAVVLFSVAVLVPLYLVDAVVLLGLGVASVGYVSLLFLVLLASLLCSVGIALLLALLARDFRTAHNINGMLAFPIILVAVAVLVGVEGSARLWLLTGILLLVAGASALTALRWLTFERYLA
jgi:ABC-type Na+ efflux pump permease subunit